LRQSIKNGFQRYFFLDVSLSGVPLSRGARTHGSFEEEEENYSTPNLWFTMVRTHKTNSLCSLVMKLAVKAEKGTTPVVCRKQASEETRKFPL
jgi:hypothetical protein